MACISARATTETDWKNVTIAPASQLWENTVESTEEIVVENELCEVDFLVNEIVGGSNQGNLNHSQFSNSKQSSKKVKTNKSLTKTPLRATSFNVSIADLLDDDQPISTSINGKSAIDDVFAKYMDEDPYASIGKFLPRSEKKSPEKPLTLFSPNEKKARRLLVSSAPQNRQRTRLFSENCPIDFNNTEGNNVTDAKKELRFSPYMERRLEASVYSPLNSPRAERQPLKNLTLRRKLNEVQLHGLVPPVGCSTPLHGEKFQFQNSDLSQRPNDSLTYDRSPCSGHHTPKPGHGSFPAYYQSPLVYIPEEVRSSILLGIICYVEVRYNKEDRSESVQKEVLALGAKVERNFTKKVTHVIFKEGKMSTFIKAKELKIPIISLLWIEACKLARGLVDPAQFAPSDNDKYLKEIPNEEERKRTRFLRRGQAFLDRLNGVLPRKPQQERTNTKMATTVGKRKNSRETVKAKATDATRGRKKLIFNKDASNGINGRKTPDADSDYGSDVESDGPKEDQKRRRSAPGAVGEGIGRQQKLTSFIDLNLNKRKNACDKVEVLKTPPKSNKMAKSEEGLTLLTGGFSSKNNKRRKLFDPKDTGEFDSFPSTPVALSPFIKDTPPSKRVRTGSSKKKKTPTQGYKPLTGARKSLVPLMEQEEDMNRSSAHNSMSFFDLNKKSNGVPKCELRIAFTGLYKEEAEELKKAIQFLGSFKIDLSVSKKTTHLVTSLPAKRTVNLLKALAQGCWILEAEWIRSSRINGKWMLEDPFELKSFSDAVTTCRLERQAFGKDYSMDLFSRCGRIFVDSSVQPPRLDLIDLLKLCCANVVSISSSADIIVSLRPLTDDIPHVTLVNPKWVLDSITQNNLLAKDQYKL